MKQTAVNWLIEISRQRELDKFDFQKALDMEQQQIEDAYTMGSYDMAAKEFNPSKYYEEVYESK